jgi:hypothetical protein
MISETDPIPAASSSVDQAGELPLEPARQTALRYCLILFLFPLLAIPAGILLGRSDFFLHHGASIWVRSNDAVFDMHNRECDVVVFGDSTAMTGIDPDWVEGHTGFRTCNIAVTNAVLAVTDNLTLDHFLAHNARPRVLLVQLSPDDFQPENHAWHQTIYAEGMLEQLRHGNPRESREILISHPQEAIGFSGYAIGYTAWYGLKRIWFHTTHMRPEEDNVQVRDGSTFFTPPSPARSSCQPTPSVPPSNNPSEVSFSRALVADYRQGYSTRAGVILVNVAPIPSCDRNLAAYTAELNGITSNSLLDLPIGLFNDGRHYTAKGSEIVSELVSKELNAVAARNPSIDDRIPTTRALATLRRAHVRVRRSSPAIRQDPTQQRRTILGLLIYPRELVYPPGTTVAPATPTPAEERLSDDVTDRPAPELDDADLIPVTLPIKDTPRLESTGKDESFNRF